MKKSYILYCYIISIIIMPFKWFAPEHMEDLSEWGFKGIIRRFPLTLQNPVRCQRFI